MVLGLDRNADAQVRDHIMQALRNIISAGSRLMIDFEVSSLIAIANAPESQYRTDVVNTGGVVPALMGIVNRSPTGFMRAVPSTLPHSIVVVVSVR